MCYIHGRIYEGEWKNDMRSGRGYERHQNGDTYSGQFLLGKPHGHGVRRWAGSGQVYDGEWKQGVKHGYGIWKAADNVSYIGEWKDGQATGQGAAQFANGDRYEGEWVNFQKHGQGQDLFANGDSYRGSYVQGQPQGQGFYKWANGNVYEGQFELGLKQGKGRWKKGQLSPGEPSSEYFGGYHQDKKHGYGEFKWASGNSYKGEFRNDEREGHGEMKWVDGSSYIGEWLRGIQHGYGKMHFADGQVREGYFESNIYVGPTKPLNKNSHSRSASQLGTMKPFKSVGRAERSNETSRVDKQQSDSYNYQQKEKGFTKKLNMNSSNGFFSAARLKKRLESPINSEQQGTTQI